MLISAAIALVWLGAFVVVFFFGQWWTLIAVALFVETTYLVAYRNTRLIVNEEGVRYENWLGQVTFASTWSEVENLDFTVNSRKGTKSDLRLQSATQSCPLGDFEGLKEIAEIVRERAPHATVAPSLLPRVPELKEGDAP